MDAVGNIKIMRECHRYLREVARVNVREPALYDEDRARGVRFVSEAFRRVRKRLGQKRPETALWPKRLETVFILPLFWHVSQVELGGLVRTLIQILSS